MIVYHYEPDTGVYANTSSEADPDPLDPGKWLIPANATDKVPPSVPNPMKQHPVFTDGAWHVESKPVEPIVNKNITEAPAHMWPHMSIKEALKGGVT